MSPVIHFELDALCLLLLCAVVRQSKRNVNQQMSRVLFRTTAYGIIFQLVLDILWLLVERRLFPGAIPLNRVINALYLATGVCLGCVWYLYVLETMGYRITRRLRDVVMLPGVVFTALNLASIWTEWIFNVSPDNVYSHGPLFWLQGIGAYGMILLSFLHIMVRLLRGGNDPAARRNVKKLYIFYAVTVLGAIVSLFDVGMPGTWNCASVSFVLIYMDDQNREILSGMITAMAADYRSIYHADLDKDECICVRAAPNAAGGMHEGKTGSYSRMFADYAEHCVAEADREAFLRFVEPDYIRARLANEAMISHRFLAVKDGREQFEMLRIAGVRTAEERADHIVHAIGAGFSVVDRETREAMEGRKAMTDALTRAEEASAAKTAFLHSMSHEMRTPMNAIIGLDAIALRDPSLSPATRDNLEQLGSSARRLLSLIDDILDMSRIESGRMTLKEEEFSLGELLTPIDVIIGGQCKDKGLSYENRTADTDGRFIGDGLRLGQVLVNILGNAVKFTDPPGSVRFIAEQDDAGDGRCLLRFTVEDTGVGIDPAFLPRLFEPFAQEDDSITSRYGGSGLGLALTKNMVELMGGSIAVESEKGRGSRFTVELPLPRAPQVPAEEPDAEADEPEFPVAGLHVLIVEDMELNAEIVADLLEMEDVTSEWAENGKIAVELFSGSEPGYFDAVLMDVRMPVMDGLTATRELRALARPDAARVPIIALTANALEEDVKQCLEAGMDAHLAKPVDIDKLKAVLGRLLAERQKE